MQGQHADGTTVETSEEETTDAGSYRGFSLRCGDCEALAFDWISTGDGGIEVRCAFCGTVAIGAADAELGEEQIERMERLEERRDRI